MKELIEIAMKRPFATVMIIGSLTAGIANIVKAASLITTKDK